MIHFYCISYKLLLFHSDGEEDEDELNSLFDFDNAILPSTILTPDFSEHSLSKTHYGDGIV